MDKEDSTTVVKSEVIMKNPTQLLRQTCKNETNFDTVNDNKKLKLGNLATKPISLRHFKRIPIFIVNYHNDVLQFIYRCLAARFLPLKNNILIHFDSHPDLVISNKINANSCYDKEIMLAELSIENWIMPMCYTGCFTRIIWLKNSWCEQIPCGKYKFQIGHNEERIYVDCPLEYFISEGNYCASTKLECVRDINLDVYNADTQNFHPNEFLNSQTSKFILDIDLDFFSTANPFLDTYKKVNCYNLLYDIFFLDIASMNYEEAAERKRNQLQSLETVFLQLSKGVDLVVDTNQTIPKETLARIDILSKLLHKYYTDDEIDWKLIYDAGTTIDSKGLPHHISTREELKEYFGYFKQFLQRLPMPPIAITIARSSEDEYCPKIQVDFIQRKVLHILKDVFGTRLHEKPIFHKCNDNEWDVMKF